MDIKNITFVRIAPFLNFDNAHPQDILIPFGIGYAAALLTHRGYNINIIDTWAEKLSLDEVINIILKRNANVVIVDCQTPTVNIAVELFGRIKAKCCRIFTLAMGQHATVLPQSFLSNNHTIDICVRGEPENTITEVLEYLSSGKDIRQIKGIAYFDNKNNKIIINPERELIHNLDILPFIDYDLFKIEKYRKTSSQVSLFGKIRWGFLLTSRGCPYECIYCSPTLRKSFGKSYRAISPNRVVDEMEYLTAHFGINAISIEDDNFTFNKQRIYAICREIIRRKLKIKWVAQAYIGNLDKSLIKEMRNANCEGLCLGVESGSDRILELLKKGIDKAKIRRIIEDIKKAGIKLTLFFMIGNPTETYEEMEETLQFARELSPLMIQVAYYTPYPGSSIFYDRESKFKDYSHYNRFVHNFSKVDIEKVKQFQKRFYKEFYFSMRYFLRYFRQRGVYSIYRRSEIELVQNALRFLVRRYSDEK